MNSAAHEPCETHTCTQRSHEVKESSWAYRCERVSWRPSSVASRVACVFLSYLVLSVKHRIPLAQTGD